MTLLDPSDARAAAPEDLGVQPPDAILRALGTATGLKLDVTRTLIAGNLVRTIDGASTLSFTVLDPECEIIKSKTLHNRLDLHYLGTWWRLVKVQKSGNDVSLTFEDRDVAHLRQHHKFIKASRGSLTRAQFIQRMVREVKMPPITFVCPELRERQAVGKAVKPTDTVAAASGDDDAGNGMAADAEVTIKGKAATARQRKNMQLVMDTAKAHHAPMIPATALVMAVIQESQAQNLTYGHSSSVGILQLLDIHLGGSTSTHGGRRDIELVCKLFLTKGFFSFGGAIQYSHEYPKDDPASVATHVQGNDQSAGHGAADYAPWQSEAEAWLEAYGYKGADASFAGATRTFAKKYEFRRGEPGQPEDSWTAIHRLADEVRWRAFMNKGRLYFMSEDRLIRSRPVMTIDQDSEGIDWIDFDVDSGKPVQQVTVTCRAARWFARPGSVVVVKNMGVANGRWLVQDIQQDLFDHAATITLKSREHKLKEPAHELVTQQVGTDLSLTGELRDRIVAVAEASRENYNKHPSKWFYSQAGASNADDPTRPPKPGRRSDCSQWVAAVYKKAGAPSPCSGDYGTAFTGNMKVKGYGVGIGDLKPGDVIIYGSGGGHHVELYVGPGNKTIGHGSAPVDYGKTDMMGEAHGWRYYFLDGRDAPKTGKFPGLRGGARRPGDA